MGALGDSSANSVSCCAVYCVFMLFNKGARFFYMDEMDLFCAITAFNCYKKASEWLDPKLNLYKIAFVSK